MNHVTATYDFASKQWVINSDNLHGEFGEIQMIFARTYETVNLPPNFKFGFSIHKDNELLLSKQYPDEFSKFEMADSYPLAIERVWFVSEHTYRLYVWTKIDQEIAEYEKTFTVARPPKPYPSWNWVEGFWTPPIPKPINGPYNWNEEQQTWDPMLPADDPHYNSYYANMPQYGDEQYSPELGRMVKSLNNEHHRPSPLGSPGVEIRLDPSKV